MTILSCIAVIEDDTDERIALGRVLRAADSMSRVTRRLKITSPEAVEPLCLILDMQLEEMSGLELLRGLRTHGSTLPVFVITGSDNDGSRSEAEQLGCVAYLRKPFQGRGLVALLRTLAAEAH